MRTPQPIDRLMQHIGHLFTSPALLKEALTHRSYGQPNNERFEFVGDGILNYTIARMLFDAFPELSEGQLSRLRANLVNQATLAEIARELTLGDCLFLGDGERKSGGHDRPSILADAMEAIFAAVCLDADFAVAENVVRRLYAARVAGIDLNRQAKDATTRLQEMLQARRLPLPAYRILNQSGDAHLSQFEVACDIPQLGLATCGEGSSRRAAEQLAAERAIEAIEAQDAKTGKPRKSV